MLTLSADEDLLELEIYDDGMFVTTIDLKPLEDLLSHAYEAGRKFEREKDNGND